ncbi:MAG TPA: hypothetical protein V6D29_04100 [Leptolyngbyaceae cyanobacterium]
MQSFGETRLMENAAWMDWLLGGMALSMLAGGLWMLFSGVKDMGGQ